MRKNREIILALDSSSVPLVMALGFNGRVYCARKSGVKQEEYLFPLIKKLLDKAGCSFKDIGRFFFIKGPGRFTGIRISLTLASMLKEFAHVEISSASVFDVLICQARQSAAYKKWLAAHPRGIAAVIMHAFRNEYFARIYDGFSGPAWVSGEELFSLLDGQNRPVFIIGRGAHGAPLRDFLPPRFTYAPRALNIISPKTLLNFKPDCKQTSKEVLQPLYLKPARFELGK
ncbi:MAG: tRNA (adenosine(37)-N6)-threonylcarbamoyltransferase complex dimerization subunit type 1 TsaB [Elusimicrobiota bacterium]|jgi:tRNA threonylcarbamoyl adenosine modification protein YeaZ|nr:tRNA (adenosine(37)-N6)-threonylcarbamoyltransferase complex dimerization subunit type 1 TsaB [Elusimicrobiota bacterium]